MTGRKGNEKGEMHIRRGMEVRANNGKRRKGGWKECSTGDEKDDERER